MEPDYLKTAPYWAQQIYKRTTALGRQNIELLFKPRRWHIEGCGWSGYRLFLDNRASVQLRGAHNNLARLVWPADRPSGKKRKRGSSSVVFDDDRKYFGRSGGMERGKDVHKELEDFIMMPPDRFQHVHPKVDPLTSSVLRNLKQYGLKPIASEVTVGDVQLSEDGKDIVIKSHSGTALDIVCINTLGEIETVETKTGYSGTNFAESDEKTLNMRAPFAHLKDTPLVRAKLQLLYGAVLLHVSKGIRPTGLWIAHGSPDTDEAILHQVDHSVLNGWNLMLSGLRTQHVHELKMKELKKAAHKNAPKPKPKNAKGPLIIIKL